MADLASVLAVSGKEFYTAKLIPEEECQQYELVPYFPSPKYEFWQDIIASEIARFLPMFEMIRHGINATISILRGRYIAGEVMQSWLM